MRHCSFWDLIEVEHFSCYIAVLGYSSCFLAGGLYPKCSISILGIGPPIERNHRAEICARTVSSSQLGQKRGTTVKTLQQVSSIHPLRTPCSRRSPAHPRLAVAGDSTPRAAVVRLYRSVSA